MKLSKKSISLIVATTLLQSTFAFSQGLTPAAIEEQARIEQERLAQKLRRHQQNQGGLTPAQVEADQSVVDPRQAERIARDRILAEQAQQERLREQARLERQRQEAIRQQQIYAQQQAEYARQEALRQQAIYAQQQAEIARQEAILQQQIYAQQQAELNRQAADLETRRQAQMEADRLAALRGSSNIVFTDVTRKKHGEWLRVTLAQPMILSQVQISVLVAAVQVHQAIIRLDNGLSLTVDALNETGTFGTNEVRGADLRNIQNRIVAIDFRAESMGAKSILNIKLDSVEGTPVLTKTRFLFK